MTVLNKDTTNKLISMAEATKFIQGLDIDSIEELHEQCVFLDEFIFRQLKFIDGSIKLWYSTKASDLLRKSEEAKKRGDIGEVRCARMDLLLIYYEVQKEKDKRVKCRPPKFWL